MSGVQAGPSTTADPPPPGIQYVLAWDIEKSGPRTDLHSMLALGAVVLRVCDDRVMSEFVVYIKMQPGHSFSEVCRKEYWYDWDRFPMNQVVLQRIEERGVDPKKGIQMFANWLDRQELTYTEAGLALATDNPASDARWVSHYFQEYMNRNPMIHPYGKEKMYRRLHHSNAFARALSMDDGSKTRPTEAVPNPPGWCDRLRAMGINVPDEAMHDHDPQNDATWIALLYTACLRYVHKQRYGA